MVKYNIVSKVQTNPKEKIWKIITQGDQQVQRQLDNSKLTY